MHPDFESLSRYALRESSAAEAVEIAEHVRACAVCRKEVRHLALVDLGLLRVLDKVGTLVGPCPPAERWAASVDGVLSSDDRAELERHLLACDECLYRIVTVRRSRALEVPRHVLEEAHALGRVVPSRAPGFIPRIMIPVSVPRWAAFSFAAALLVLVFVFARGTFVTPPYRQVVQAPAALQGAENHQQDILRELTALKPQDGRATLLPVTPALEESLRAFQRTPNRQEQLRLLEQLHKLEPALPMQQIRTVELKGGSAGKTDTWIVLQWKESGLEIVSIQNGKTTP